MQSDDILAFADIGEFIDLPKLRTGEYFLTAAVSIGSMNNHIHLVWDDLSIQLHGEGEPIADGIFYCSTKLEVLQK